MNWLAMDTNYFIFCTLITDAAFIIKTNGWNESIDAV